MMRPAPRKERLAFSFRRGDRAMFPGDGARTLGVFVQERFCRRSLIIADKFPVMDSCRGNSRKSAALLHERNAPLRRGVYLVPAFGRTPHVGCGGKKD